MNHEIPTEGEIVSYLGKLRTDHQSMLELFGRVDAARAAEERAQKTIREIGTPQLNDEAGMSRLAGAEKMLTVSRTELAAVEQKIREQFTSSTSPLLDQGGHLVRRVLQRCLEHRRAFVAARIRPFCRTEEEAIALASQTSAVAAWSHQITGYTELYKQLDETFSRERLASAIASIDAVLVASCRMESKVNDFLCQSWPLAQR